ncbi:caspase family protein [Actinoplanes sp. KI2]|uniref:caspase family protein n=1 Tax=Actinoplanes sp. KI2 TaxID=2983315 RepID=UPI0021D5890D|nr:caspase family protein [Actinoplanes sp. KI2]MCU7728866.1 caspase family protein [Actinoplanes sp. KI2]
MTRKALLIGAQTNGLGGVLHDVEAMAGALEPRGFTVQRLITPDATRAAVLDAYEKVIADAQPDDAIVLYYSGHGGRLLAPDGSELQFIVPDDYHDSSDSDFRGITGVELSVLLARLTDKARNVTVVLDCCHAAHMSRDAGLRIKTLLRTAPEPWHPTYEAVQAHVTKLAGAGLAVDRRSLISNPYAVRVVACSPAQSAWEGANRDGVRMGLLTDALTRALRESERARVNWATMLEAVRRSVQELAPTQRPETEGPSTREPFEPTDLDPLAGLPLLPAEPEHVELLGAPLLGVELGDEFAIMRSGARGPQDGPAIGTATVDRILPTSALARLRLASDDAKVPVDARAHRTHSAAPRLPVRLPADHPVAADLGGALALRPLLVAAEAGAPAPVEVTVDAQGGLVVRDAAGPLHRPYPATPLGISSIADNLQRIAQATALRRLDGDPARPLAHRVSIEWGRVRDGRAEPLPNSGALLFAYAGERVYFRLTNLGDQPAYVSLVDIGVGFRVAVLTAADPGGVLLEKGASYTYGWDDVARRLTGVAMTWPDGVDTTYARPETVLALISDGPVDVSVLQQQTVRAAHRIAARPGLESLLTQIATGATRDVDTAPVGQVRYAVEPIDFTVSPNRPPAAERATFLVDDRPSEPVRLLSARGAAPGAVAIRIDELIVHRNRALGSADIRVDTLVLTGGAGDRPAYRAETMRFSNIHDGERLPLERALIYHGPAVDFLDIAVWVSRDTAGSQALGSLLEHKLTSPVVQFAETQVAGLVLSAPHAAAAVAVAGAAAVLVNTGYELLSGVVGPSIGLYRTSLLAQEQFGLGRHERHPQDFSFAYSVDAVI